MAGSPQRNTRRSWVRTMSESNTELHDIASTQTVYEEVVELLLKLNNDLFWKLMQLVSTEELSEQLEERQKIDNLYKTVTN